MTAPTAASFALDFEIRGTGDPVLFISGTSDQRSGWAPNVPALEDNYRCITFDNRDVGESPRADGPYSIEEMARDTLGVLDRAGVERAHIIGHSMGSQIAQELAITAPERVRSLVLVGGFPAVDPYMRGALENWKTWVRTLNSFDFTRGAIYYWVGETIINAEGPEALSEAIAPLIDSQGPEAFCRQVDSVLAYNAIDRLGRITAPTLLVWGTEEKLVLEHQQRTFMERIPNTTYVRLEGAGHSPTFEQPESFNAAVKEFLATVS
jgi:pimeloyl-ACP methyl ester carboxylesterase